MLPGKLRVDSVKWWKSKGIEFLILKFFSFSTMLLRAMLIKSIFAFLIIIINSLEVSNEPKWVRQLTKHIQQDLKIFQTIMIVDDSAGSHDVRIIDIVRKIQQTVSTKVMNLNSTTSDGIFERYRLHQNLEKSTLIILIQVFKHSPKNLATGDTIKFLVHSLEKSIRPKCLMIALPNKGNLMCRELLEYMWSQYFLDFTILEIREKEKGSFYRNGHQQVAIFHNFNPFNGTYTKQNYTTNLKLFPNKLEDLYGFEMKVGSFHFPPFLFVERNSSGHPLQVNGEDAQIVKAISKKMNFLITEVPSLDESVGHWNCKNESETTGNAHLISHNKIRFLTNRAMQFVNCEGVSRASKRTGSVDICALVRITSSPDYSPSLTMKWMYLILLVLTIWVITYLLKFENDVWSWLEILRVMLGFSVPREPQRLSERIAFISILIAFSVFSCSVFAILTDMKLTKKPEMKFNTLGELNRSGLVPMMREDFAIALKQTSNRLNEELLKRSKIISNDETCVDMILQWKNVTCIMRELVAQMVIEKHRDYDGSPLMKIVKQRFLYAVKVIHFEPKSPYVRKIDTILERLIESGLIDYWEMKFLPNSRKISKNKAKEELQSISVLFPLVFFLAVGCALSIVVFICELLIIFAEKRLHVCVFYGIQGSVF